MGTILHSKIDRATQYINDPTVDISATNKDGVSALMFCFGKREYGLAELLINKGADVTAENKDGVSALVLALKTVRDEETRLKMVSMLVEHGADIVELSKTNVKAKEYLDMQVDTSTTTAAVSEGGSGSGGEGESKDEL